jgi:L-iditol 2-dehydrogenase
MPADVAAALEPLACVVRGTRRVRLADAGNVLVIGDGAIALLFVQLIRRQTQGRIVVAGHHASRLEVARALGADATTLATSGDVLRADVESAGSLADVVIECVGTSTAWDTAASLVAKAGQVLLFGGRAAGERADIDAFRVHYEELDVLGAFHYGREDVREALALLADRSVRIAPLVTHRVALARFADALDLVLERRAIKVAIEPVAS